MYALYPNVNLPSVTTLGADIRYKTKLWGRDATFWLEGYNLNNAYVITPSASGQLNSLDARRFEDCVPTALGFEESPGRAWADLAQDECPIGADARENLILQLGAEAKQRGRGPLHGSANGEIGIGDYLQSGLCGLDVESRTTGDDPCDLHLRKRRDLRNTAQGECQRLVVAGKTLAGNAIMRVVEKNFIDDQRQAMFAAHVV